MVREFIEGWDLMQILGEGTFAEVKLLVNRETGEACAMKEIDLGRNPQAAENTKKEICVHKLLKHQNIVQCYGSRLDGKRQFIFLEYCSGGELFDRIEPEIGMPEHQAQYYFNQIIAGLDYLHHRGVAHRDIKPENLLLTEGDVLKISDFGMATVFRHQGKERMLERRCGTMPYMSPEVLLRPNYNAEPADIWSAGIVLVAMLTGELPWDQATPDQYDFQIWKDQEYDQAPRTWKRVDNLPLALLRKILLQSPSRRYTLSQIQNHIWCKKKFKDSDGKLLEPDLISPPFKKYLVNPGDLIQCRETSDSDNGDAFCKGDNVAVTARLSASQPATAFKPTRSPSSTSSTEIDKDGFGGFTQPAQMSDLYCGSQSGTQTQTQSQPYQRLVKRMTRFWVKTSITETEKFLNGLLGKLKYSYRCKSRGIFTIDTTDRRGAMLTFKATLIQVDQKILVDFRLSRGDGLEFKKHFGQIKKNCKEVIENGPIMWPALVAADAIPGVP